MFMVNENRAHLSVIIKVMKTLINGAITILLAILVFYIFYPKKVSILAILTGILTIVIILFIPLQILFGLFHNILTTYNPTIKLKFYVKLQ